VKNVLIITYYWPPSGGGGVQRWLKFSKYLPGCGWNCTVCTPENPDFDIKDYGLENEVHPDTEVLKLPIWEPYKIFKKLKGEQSLEQGVTPEKAGSISRFIRGNFFIPDPRCFWVKPAVRFLEHYLKNQSIDLIITTGPPHSMHLIGEKLNRKLGVPWVADFRDPWSGWDMLQEFSLTLPARWWHKRLESRVFKRATGILTVSPHWASEFEAMYAKEVKVITNGFDKEDIRIGNIQPEFQLTHAGLLNAFRNVPLLWESIVEFNATNDISLGLTLRGMIDPNVLKEITSHDIPLNNSGSIPHEEIFSLYHTSFSLLLIMNRSRNAAGHIPGKLFEYMVSGRWILAIGDPQGDVAEILKKTGCGWVIHWDDKKAMRETLEVLAKNYKENRLPKPEDLTKFSRKHLTMELSHYMDKMIFKNNSQV
jgi:glycosyltransferase involved in cell wall biosynthesis